MSKTDFENEKNNLLAIPKDNVKTPGMPVDVNIQEAENLHVWCKEDKEGLTAKGLDWGLVESIPARAGVLRYTEADWQKDARSQHAAELEWAKIGPKGFTLRDYLVQSCRYAYRKDAVLTAKVNEIAEGTSREDMIQDLSNLSQLGKGNQTPLEKIKFDFVKLDEADVMADTLAKSLAELKTGQKTASNELEMRNRAYTYLKEAVDEVRACGRYVFWENPDRLKGYHSEYGIRQNRKYRGKDNTGEKAAE